MKFTKVKQLMQRIDLFAASCAVNRKLLQ